MIATKSLQISRKTSLDLVPPGTKISSLASQTKKKEEEEEEEARGKREERERGEKESIKRKGYAYSLAAIVSKQTTTGQKERDAANQEQSQLLFMAILILKWYLMSHQARTDLSRSRGYNPHSPPGSPLCRTCYCRYTYSYVCFCAAAASHSYIPHRSTNDGVELPDGTPRGVRDLYPVWLPCFSTSPPSVLFLPYSRGIRPSPSHAQPRRGSVRACTVDPCWPRCFAKRKRLYPARSTERADDNRPLCDLSRFS